MIDEDGDGAVDFDEAAKIVRTRYGKQSDSVPQREVNQAHSLPQLKVGVVHGSCRQSRCCTRPIDVCRACRVAGV